MRKFSVFLYCLIAFLLASCGQPAMTSIRVTRTPLSISKIIEGLNEWNAKTGQDIDVALCSDLHPKQESAGETNALITRSYKKLETLGVYIRWNCEIQAFEITEKGNTEALCGCK